MRADDGWCTRELKYIRAPWNWMGKQKWEWTKSIIPMMTCALVLQQEAPMPVKKQQRLHYRNIQILLDPQNTEDLRGGGIVPEMDFILALFDAKNLREFGSAPNPKSEQRFEFFMEKTKDKKKNKKRGTEVLAVRLVKPHSPQGKHRIQRLTRDAWINYQNWVEARMNRK